jgi:hypothetical protein
LGTRNFPFKALDDPFRELFRFTVSNSPNDGNINGIRKIFIKYGSNVTMHSVDMPLIAMNI